MSIMSEFFTDDVYEKEVIDKLSAIKCRVDHYCSLTQLKHSFPNLNIESLETIYTMLEDAEQK